MESTGVYWRPVYNIVEGVYELSLVNAQHVKMVPDKKTDVRDSEWLAQFRNFVRPAWLASLSGYWGRGLPLAVADQPLHPHNIRLPWWTARRTV